MATPEHDSPGPPSAQSSPIEQPNREHAEGDNAAGATNKTPPTNKTREASVQISETGSTPRPGTAEPDGSEVSDASGDYGTIERGSGKDTDQEVDDDVDESSEDEESDQDDVNGLDDDDHVLVKGQNLTVLELKDLIQILKANIDEQSDDADANMIQTLCNKFMAILRDWAKPTSQQTRGRKRQRDGSASGSSSPGSERPAKAQRRDVWQLVKDMDMLHIPPEVSRLLDQSKNNVAVLLQGQKSVACGIIAQTRALSKETHFMAVLNYTLNLEGHGTKLNFRWCFQMLFFADLVTYLCPKAKRISDEVKTKVERFLRKSLNPEYHDPDNIKNRIKEWGTAGKKLDKLCQKLGAGCIFYLSEILTPNFVKNRMTLEGTPFKEAMSHLQGLKMQEIAEEEGYNARAIELRELLIGPFKLKDN